MTPPAATAWSSATSDSRRRKAGWLSAQTIEAGRIAAQQYLRTGGAALRPRVSAQVDHLDSLGNPHGQGKGRTGVLGGRHQAGHGVCTRSAVCRKKRRGCAFARLAHKMPVRVRFLRRRSI